MRNFGAVQALVVRNLSAPVVLPRLDARRGSERAHLCWAVLQPSFRANRLFIRPILRRARRSWRGKSSEAIQHAGTRRPDGAVILRSTRKRRRLNLSPRVCSICRPLGTRVDMRYMRSTSNFDCTDGISVRHARCPHNHAGSEFDQRRVVVSTNAPHKCALQRNAAHHAPGAV